jgi:hypothetical protein
VHEAFDWIVATLKGFALPIRGRIAVKDAQFDAEAARSIDLNFVIDGFPTENGSTAGEGSPLVWRFFACSFARLCA